MSVSLGFRRLSIFVATLGFIVASIDLYTKPAYMHDHMGDVVELIGWIAVPCVFALLVGWVVAGFKTDKSN